MNTVHGALHRLHNPDLGVFFVRIALGAVFMHAGWLKLGDMNMVVTGFASMGFPAWLAYVVAYAEFLGGIAMILGIFVRYAGIILAVIMFVAFWKVHAANGFSLANGGYEYVFVLFSSALALVAFGSGKYSLARLLKNRTVRAQFEVAAFGIILDENKKVLLCHRRDYDLWNLPGGGMEQGEAPWDCVKREAKEETGLDVEVVKFAGVYGKPEDNAVQFSFICKIVGGEIAISNEMDKFGYFAVNDIPKNTTPKQVERIKDALRDLPEAVLKVQKGKSAVELVKEGKL
ncbi:MAG: NUDIX domain-containing protein [Candidatus Liptonbacteria bacterium]|nr:NUDIX domain-containing protein [Candidatus Liptonbacteria bacterium]